MDAPAEECSAAAAAAARVEALFQGLPGGYDVDKEASTYDDNLTYGEMATADLALLCQRVRQAQQANARRRTDPPPGSAARRAGLRRPRFGHWQDGYCSCFDVQIRHRVGDSARACRSRSSRACEAWRRRCGRQTRRSLWHSSLNLVFAHLLRSPAPSNVRLVCGDFLAQPLTAGVVFTHNMVFSRALQRAMQLKMDRELPPGAHGARTAQAWSPSALICVCGLCRCGCVRRLGAAIHQARRAQG